MKLISPVDALVLLARRFREERDEALVEVEHWKGQVRDQGGVIQDLAGRLDAARAEVQRLREAHAAHVHEGWCPLCDPIEYRRAVTGPLGRPNETSV